MNDSDADTGSTPPFAAATPLSSSSTSVPSFFHPFPALPTHHATSPRCSSSSSPSPHFLLLVDDADLAMEQRLLGAMGLAAIIEAHPYDLPEWMPEALEDLAHHIRDEKPIDGPLPFFHSLLLPILFLYVSSSSSPPTSLLLPTSLSHSFSPSSFSSSFCPVFSLRCSNSVL